MCLLRVNSSSFVVALMNAHVCQRNEIMVRLKHSLVPVCKIISLKRTGSEGKHATHFNSIKLL